MSAPAYRVFFICTGNSARSQMAEGLANHLGGDRLHAESAGTYPVGVNSHAVAVMSERGIDITKQFSKRIDEVPGPFDLVITLCDNAALLCPVSVRDYPMEHWSTPDPTWVPGGPQAVHRAFQEVRDRLEEQILDLMKRLDRAGRPAPKAPQDAPPLKKRMARS
ncbi:MAG TPA: arsenate reductase ArsC [Candidatus Polarisedimenticolia bacterium]|jgi:arsenate reductase|nr:arsenate reductase ArsC [Candidatus Polarisedimenticolia bacterium]